MTRDKALQGLVAFLVTALAALLGFWGWGKVVEGGGGDGAWNDSSVTVPTSRGPYDYEGRDGGEP